MNHFDSTYTLTVLFIEDYVNFFVPFFSKYSNVLPGCLKICQSSEFYLKQVFL